MEEKKRQCKKYPGYCPCENAKCKHSVSMHETCWECNRWVGYLNIPKYIVMNAST
jgi:hypothetical protein